MLFPHAPSAAIRARFLAKIEFTRTCWNWLAAKTHDGYGNLGVLGRNVRAHRMAFEWSSGRSIPAGMEIDHLCFNRACVNPKHLDVTTHHRNLLRGEGIPARNLRKTHCPLGHPLSGANLIVEGGRRRCRDCRNRTHRESSRRRYAANRGVR